MGPAGVIIILALWAFIIVLGLITFVSLLYGSRLYLYVFLVLLFVTFIGLDIDKFIKKYEQNRIYHQSSLENSSKKVLDEA